MIANEEEFSKAIEQMERMYRALAALKARGPAVNRAQFNMLAEGPVDEIRRLQADIDSYLGVAVGGPI